MVAQVPLLVLVLTLIDQIPMSPAGSPRRGRLRVYSDRLFLVIMVLRHLATVHALVAMLEQPTAEMQQVRHRLMEAGRYPSRWT